MFIRAKNVVAGIAAFCVLTVQANACDTEGGSCASFYRPHIDFRYKLGNERTLGSTEIFLPLQTSGNSLLFADIRGVIDSNGASEGNVGLGLREMILRDGKAKGIAGVYLFVDRRRSANDNYFSQATLGAEWLSNTWDFRVNTYLPTTNAKRAGLTPSLVNLAGNGIFVTSGEIKEKALRGYDIEVGHSLTDDARLYVGGYQFVGKNVTNIQGVRGRLEWDVNDHIRLGLESQHDHVRGNNSYAEVRLSIPLGKAPKEKLKGLYKRMTSPIVRDIDIVTNEQGALNRVFTVNSTETGTTQQIWYVDNSGPNGDGTVETPFDNLAAAAAAAGAGDVIYVAFGDGTSTNMDAGVVLAAAGQKLIGAGVDFTFDTAAFSTSADALAVDTSTILKAATTAPLLINAGGNVVDIGADNIEVAGVTVGTSGLRGVNIANVTGTNLHDMTVTNSAGQGIYASYGAGDYTLDLDNVTFTNNTLAGVFVNNLGATNVAFTATNSTSSGNSSFAQIRGAAGTTTATINGFSDTGSTGSAVDIDAVSPANVSAIFIAGTINNATSKAMDILAGTGTSITTVLNDILITNAGDDGVTTSAITTGYNALTATSLTVDNSALRGIDAVNTNLDLTNVTLSNNTLQGVKATYNTAGNYTVNMQGVTTANNSNAGNTIQVNTAGANVTFVGDALADTGSTKLIRFTASSGGVIDAQLNDFSSLNATVNGLDVVAKTGGSVSVTLTAGVISNTTTNGLEFLSTSGTSSITAVVSDVLIANAGENGFEVEASALANVTLSATSVTVDNSTLNGFDVSVTTTATFEGLFDNVTSKNNLRDGFSYIADSVVSSSLTIDTGTFDNNSQEGISVLVSGTGANNTLNIYDSFARQNTSYAGRFFTQDSASAQMNIQRNLFSQSLSDNITILSSGSSNFTMLFTDNDSINSNAWGFGVQTQTSGNFLIKSERNTITGNGFGIAFAAAVGGSVADMDWGGGTQGSVGQNRIFGNTGFEVLTLTGVGGIVAAQNNWWGVSTGLPVGEKIEISGSIDATNHLTVDPNP